MTHASGRDAAPLADFAGIYDAYAGDLRRFALYLSGDAALADDLVSEAFVRAWTAWERVKLPTVRAYLFTIVRNLFLHHVRDERRRAPLDRDAVDERPGPEERVTDQRDLAIVLAALRALPEVDRAALLMRVDEQVSYRGNLRRAGHHGGGGKSQGAPGAPQAGRGTPGGRRGGPRGEGHT